MIKSKVCRLAWDYPVAGRATYGLQPVFVNISREQVRQGYEVHVIAPRHGQSPREEVDEGVRVHRVAPPFGLNAYRKIGELMGRAPDEWVVHAHATSGMFLAPLKYLRPYRVFAHVHGTSKRRFRGSQNGARHSLKASLEPLVRVAREKIAWTSADRVLSICNFISEDLEKCYGINPRTIRLVYNGVDERVFSRADGAGPLLPELAGKKVVLYVGHFGKRKGVIDLIRAMKSVTAEERDAHLLCIGGLPNWLNEGGYWDYLRHEVESNGLSKCVTMMDAIPNQELVRAYSGATVFVLPSYSDSVPKVVLEAMSCKNPVVATRQGGLPEMVDDGESGFLVRYGDLSGLAEAVTSILGDERKARAMGMAGRAKVERMFTWSKVVEKVGRAYEER